MTFGFTEEQDMLRSEVHKFLAKRCPLLQRLECGHGWLIHPDGYTPSPPLTPTRLS